ncbi:SPOR domain-containing protein [Algoriphagus mannitolivorans]|uniref:SPOR domain-containing protein n=1 Tax=Algoriphagus mannitolivorans TaxID=226504 RepID=UPI0004006251|nr:SPOR domain-containing protein [Algoriphagus mannitolivorans]
MAVKDSDKNQWKDPKDFGLPWVEVKPIKDIPAEGKAKEEKPEKTDLPEEVRESVSAAVPVVSEAPKKKSQPKEKPVPQPISHTSTVEKSSNTWAWIVAVLAIGIVGVILWQMQKQTSEESLPVKAEIQPEVPVIQPAEIQDSTAQVASIGISQDSVNQESIEKNSPANLNISKPVESGTTIAQSVKGNLIRIENQTERPQYFIVVGSLPSEQDAMKLAPGYQARVPEVFLIYPYAESSNYRLAIGKFTSFRKAAEELERIKSQYTEELWILKY